MTCQKQIINIYCLDIIHLEVKGVLAEEPCALVLLYLMVEAVKSDCKEELWSFSGEMLMVWVTSDSTSRLFLFGVQTEVTIKETEFSKYVQ